MSGSAKNAFELLQEVKKTYTGARRDFIVSRLCLRTRMDLESLTNVDADPGKADRLRQAIREICPEVSV